ncbi:MAG TPA: PadR family transcriptional regulator [Vicinamibacteria bacterium]|jgi:DNA-binding PadR family transcriptional regulator
MALKPEDFLILLVLSRGERHGYGIMKEVESESGGEVQLGIGSLYRLLGRMMRGRLVAAAAAARGEDPRRRNYRLTPQGERVLREESQRLAALVQKVKARGLLAR